VAHIPIDLPNQSVHIHADRELAFEMVSALGTGTGQGGVSLQPMSKVIEKHEDRMLVEFTTPLKLWPISVTWKSTEWVTSKKPTSIDFELVPARGIVRGALRQLSDHFEFEKEGNCTRMTYRSRFGMRWSIGGWVLGKVLIGPIIKDHMVEHLGEVKELVENRARRSRIYPQTDCTIGDV
jgi:hypothetical protein